jgi:hypothetical protein
MRDRLSADWTGQKFLKLVTNRLPRANARYVYKGCFFKEGEEGEFEIRDESQIDYAMELKRHLQSHPRAFVWLNIDHTNHSFT